MSHASTEQPTNPPVRALLIVNPKSRQGAEADLDAGVESLRRAGMMVEHLTSHSVQESQEAVRRRRGAIDLVIIGGGDGTIRSMAGTLLECGLALGILPLGTANDLARTLGIPARLDEAFAVLERNHRRWIDVSEVNGHHFFNVANMGLGVHVAEELSDEVKKRWGVFSYLRALCLAIARRDRFTVTIILDGMTVRLRSMQLAVGNGRYYGGGNIVHEQASIDSGVLSLYSIRPLRAWDLLLLAPLLRKGRQHIDERVYCATGQDIHISTGSRKMKVHADGEALTQTPAHFRINPAALEVVGHADTDDEGDR